MTETRRDGEAGPIRRLLLALMGVGTAGLLAELALLEHYESGWQWVPLVLLGAGLLLGIAVWLKPSAVTLRLFQALMAAYVVAGAVGFWLHFRGNVEFELESDPSLGGLALVWAALQGATPALAPGAMAQLGLLGLVLAFRHPALARRASPTSRAGAGDAPV
ncbi:MAG TPA: hypothetical protein VHG91_07565 [Longimicrobium sp.]|nr:hypothetical protein [Longimicrobium sp.]